MENGKDQSNPKNVSANIRRPSQAYIYLPCTLKSRGKLVAKQMTIYCETEATLKKSISSFRKGHSTSTALVAIRDDLFLAMKRGEVPYDISKLFKGLRHRPL